MKKFFFVKLEIGPLKNNCYILSGDGETAAVIDPSGDYPRIADALNKAGLRARHVLLTHGHFDHTGAAARLQSDGAEVYLHSDDIDKIKLSGSLKTDISRRLGDGAAVYPHSGGIDKIGEGEKAFAPDRDLKNETRLNIAGLEINVIPTPGHTAGGVCFYTDATSPPMLFSGDTLFAGDVGRADLPSGNSDALKKSIREKLYALPPETVVYPGHEEETTIGAEMKNNSVVPYR